MLGDMFLHQWGVWFCFQSDPTQSKEKYNQNFMQAYTVRSPHDLAYLWTHCNLSNLEHFLLKSNSFQNNFKVNDKWRKVNSVQFFKQGIQPKWQDPKNESGGRFVFPVNKPQQNKDQLYQNLVFYLIGQDFQRAQHINGFRFISPKTRDSYYRVEIWVDFNDSDMDTLEIYSKLLTNLFNSLNFDSKIVKFLNNKQEQKDMKETREKQGKKEYKEKEKM